MRIDNNLYQIRAEVLLNYLYPELESDWFALCKGTFYRNYNQDILWLDLDEKKVLLARDGFLRLLPEGLLTKDDDLMGEDVAEKFKQLEWRKELLNESFAPFDTYVFHKKLTIERYTSELLEQKLDYLLKKYFDFDLATVESPLVKEAAVLLPFVSRWRGDFGFVSNLLGALLNCDVEMSVGKYSHKDTTVCWLPEVRYQLLIPNLTSEEYLQYMEQLQPLVAFVKEWLIPYEVNCRVGIKQHLRSNEWGERMTLNYNTEINNPIIEENQ